MSNPNCYVSSKEDVERHLMELKKALSSKQCTLDILPTKKGEQETDPYSTAYTMQELEYDGADIRNTLKTLSLSDYKETMKDIRRPGLADFWVFGKVIEGAEVYIKEKLRSDTHVFCISFHFAKYPLKESPYK